VNLALESLQRLITFLPFNLVEQVIVDRQPLRAGIRWVNGCLLSVQLEALAPRVGKRGSAAAELEVHGTHADVTLALRRILEEAVFPRGGYLLKFSDAGALVMFTDRCPGQVPVDSTSPSARRAARCGQEILAVLSAGFRRTLDARAAAEHGRFRLALCTTGKGRWEQLALGALRVRLSALVEAAGLGELVAGPALVEQLRGWQAHVGPQRGHGRRLMSVPSEAAGPSAGFADLDALLPETPGELLDQLRGLMPLAVEARLHQGDTPLTKQGEMRPVAVASFPLDFDHSDDTDDAQVLLDVTASLTALTEAVADYGGTLLRLDAMGSSSAAVAVFGVRDTLRRATLNALSAALRVTHRLSPLSATRVRAGVEAGRAYLGEVGSPLKREIAVLGGPAVAARDLARQARRDQIVLGQTGHRLCSDELSARSLGVWPIGHAGAGVAAFDVSALVDRTDRSVPSWLRENGGDETAQDGARAHARHCLLGQLQSVASGSSGAGTVFLGATGSGKSALVSFAADHAALHGFRGPQVACPRMLIWEETPPYVLIWRQLFGVPPTASTPEAQRHVADELRPLMSPGQPVPPLLWTLLGLPRSEHMPLENPLQTTEGMLRRWIQRRSQRTPLFVSVEDLHLADRFTFLTTLWLLESASTARLVVLCTSAHQARDVGPGLSDDDRGALQSTGARLWTLPPLSHAEALRQVLTDLQINDADELGLDPGFLTAAVAVAQGDPRVLRSMTGLVKARMRQGRNAVDAWAEAVVTPGASEHCQLELDSLPVALRDVARLCSVLGVEFQASLLWSSLQAAHVPAEASHLLNSLGELVRGAILTPSLVRGEVGYRFVSNTFRDVAYASWTREAAQHWHHCVAQTLTRLPRVPPLPGLLAWHQLHTQEPADALPALLHSAGLLESRHLYALARSQLSMAIDHAPPDWPGRRETVLRAATASLKLGMPSDADLSVAGLAYDSAAPAADRAQAWLILSRGALAMHEAHAAALSATTGRKVLGRGGHLAQRTLLRAVHVTALREQGHAGRAVVLWEQVRASADRACMAQGSRASCGDASVDQAFIELGLAGGTALLSLGRTSEGVSVLEDALARARETGVTHLEAATLQQLARLRRLDDSPWAATQLAWAADLLESVGECYQAQCCQLDGAQILSDVGDLRGCADALRAIQKSGVTLLPAEATLMLALQAWVQSAQSTDQAQATLQRARVGLRAIARSQQRVRAFLQVGRVARVLGLHGDATELLGHARVLANALGSQDLQRLVDAEDTLHG
jgi:hypothetical protein